MRAARVIFAIALLLFGALITALSVHMAIRDDQVVRAVSRNHVIEAHLRKSAAFARELIESEGRIPTHDDIERWKREDPNSARGATWFLGLPFEAEVTEIFGHPSQVGKQPFVVVLGRRGAREYYASWTDTTSLDFNPSKYYILGNRYAQLGVFGAVSAALFGLAYLVWPRKRRINDA